MSKPNQAPYTWAEIEDQVRLAILCQYSILSCLGPWETSMSKPYLGVDLEMLDAEPPAPISLERHHLHRLARAAYDYAYQLDGWEEATEDHHYEIIFAVLHGFPQMDLDGEASPLSAEHDFPLRRMFETFVARWNLYYPEQSYGLSVRELSLLADMTVPAVRTSLSKEGYKLDVAGSRGEAGRRDDEKAATLNVDDAFAWLSRRRAFVPNRGAAPGVSDGELSMLFEGGEVDFTFALKRLMRVHRLDQTGLTEKLGVDPAWTAGLLNEKPVEIDVPALRKLAALLGAPLPAFVGAAVRYLIAMEDGQSG